MGRDIHLNMYVEMMYGLEVALEYFTTVSKKEWTRQGWSGKIWRVIWSRCWSEWVYYPCVCLILFTVNILKLQNKNILKTRYSSCLFSAKLALLLFYLLVGLSNSITFPAPQITGIDLVWDLSESCFNQL